ncbi:hypothetical protein [Streptomyces sp. NPDC057694]|uniref:hypothetical protein n=1 Tax=Streptomyces sp. NPDC057694 TaxID=3346216 RepID=UPI0036A77809
MDQAANSLVDLRGDIENVDDTADAAFATMAKVRTEYENAAVEAGRIGKLP